MLLYIFIFAVTLKVLPQGNMRWRDLWPGALLTTALFWLGNFVIKFYITVVFATSLHGPWHRRSSSCCGCTIRR
jgi:membrane protein